ncbi:hypothetical protein HK407_12g17760 [Ordospora pajunii]|jgi:hypothetical protein|uniref:uncharacterized protein n=1 Tax=Ordospora pajunii TaxID=3039483 RepID=UPI00295287B5|nr:uncharacterized protein HK407_12g17760 [Ordospora pajunii]KAH9410645.1 hypothetical protein HK407_12g17760 [Ordospora pajunii]
MFATALAIIPLLMLVGAFTSSNEDVYYTCTNDPKIYDINLYAHLDKMTMDAIKDAAGKGKDEKDAAYHYLYDQVLAPYNDFLSDYKVRITLNLVDRDSNSIPGMAFDRSCERQDPLERVKQMHDYETNMYKGNIGVHLFLWSCPSRTEAMSGNVAVYGDPKGCGRAIGVIWDGTRPTVNYIMQGISEAISGVREMFVDGMELTAKQMKDFQIVCNYVYHCITVNKSINGSIRYNDELSSNDNAENIYSQYT